MTAVERQHRARDARRDRAVALDAAGRNRHALGGAIQQIADEKKPPLIPDELEQFVLDRPTRLAVDPKAMAASCALLAGYQARATGESQLAAEMFGHILSNYSITRYRYYVVQAYHALKGIAGGEQFLPKQFMSSVLDPAL